MNFFALNFFLLSVRNIFYSRFKFTFVLFILIFAITNPIISQNNGCGFDEQFDNYMMGGTNFSSNFEENETYMSNMFADNPMMAAISGISGYTIPVVVHVMHKGEPVSTMTGGTNSNISDAQIDQAILDLNNAFSNANGMGADVGIQYCLAKRDPLGNATTGINRINAAAICEDLCYGPSGITVGGPLELAVKAESVWPNSDYINIWVVHDVVGDANGYAYFPGVSSAIDGIVIDKDNFGINSSTILTHETGHFWSMFHTFEGDCPVGQDCDTPCGANTMCPADTPCNTDPSDNAIEICCLTQGDRVCDTDPHKRVCGGCDETASNICTGGTNVELVHNYMNYSDETCLDRFTDGQRTRMRMTLMSSRASLMFSLGCNEPCSNVVADFEIPGNGSGDVDQPINFDNQSSGAVSYEWYVNDEIITTEDLDYTFAKPGLYEICLFAKDALDCQEKICKKFLILGVDPCDEANSVACGAADLLNPDFEAIEFPGFITQYYHFPDVVGEYRFDIICNWFNRVGSLELQDDPNPNVDFNSIILFTDDLFDESMGTQREINFIEGEYYNIKFKYSAYWSRRPQNPIDYIEIGLSPTLFDEGINNAIHQEQNIVYRGEQADVLKFQSEILDSLEFCFQFTESLGRYLYIQPVSDDAWGYIKLADVEMTCCSGPPPCDPNPMFTYVQDSCSFIFTATNDGDPGSYTWDFGDSHTGEGDVVTHEYLYGEALNVCLTIHCDQYTSETFCDSVFIPAACTDCLDLGSFDGVQCDSDSTDSYMVKVAFDVPAGTAPCEDDIIPVWSDEVFINPTSVLITEVDEMTDHVEFCFNVTPYEGFDITVEKATGFITLCDSLDNQLCYTFSVNGTECSDCSTITFEDMAVCDQVQSNDSIFVYTGSTTISGVPASFTECEATSEEAGVEFTYDDQGGGVWIIGYTITTTTELGFDFSSTLCFEFGSFKYCVQLDITIPEPCADLPTDCAISWLEKTMGCDRAEGDYIVYTFDMIVDLDPYQVCEDGLFGTIDGGGFVLNIDYTEINNSLDFSLEMHMPCDADLSQVYDLRLYLCNDQGEVICYKFPFRFTCSHDCDKTGKRSSSTGDSEFGNLSIYPNPARDNIYIDGFDLKSTSIYEVQFIDQFGRVLSRQNVKSDQVEIQVKDFSSGLYFVKISDLHGLHERIEKVLIIK